MHIYIKKNKNNKKIYPKGNNLTSPYYVKYIFWGLISLKGLFWDSK
jgi:hypothetical protein